MTTPEKLKSFIDDLARLSAKHGLCLSSDGSMRIVRTDADESYQVAGYVSDLRGLVYSTNSDGLRQPSELQEHGVTLAAVTSLDITALSNHERLRLQSDTFPYAFRRARGAVPDDVDLGDEKES